MYPTPTKGRKNKEVKSARVLTSVESQTLLEEKERQKREEAEAKEQRKQERLAKKAEKEEEKKRKQEEREAKAAEWQRIAEEKAAKKAGRTGRKRSAGERSVNQGNPKKKKSTDDQGLQGREISSSECAACFGLYEDDVNDDGDVTCDWFQCTNEQCSLWMHTTCLDKSDGEYICAVWQNMFC